MYHHGPTAAAAGGVATLPFTGMGLTWVVLAGFALFAAGLALRRMFPRRES